MRFWRSPDAIQTGNLSQHDPGPQAEDGLLSIRSANPLDASAYREKLAHIHDLSHLTIEFERAV